LKDALQWDEANFLLIPAVAEEQRRKQGHFTIHHKNEEKCPKSAIFVFGTGKNRAAAGFLAKQWTVSDLCRKRCHSEGT
jgi:hypothetical protein